MTYRENYGLLKTPKDILDEAEKDIKIAMTILGNNPNRIEKIMTSAEDVLNEKFPNFERSVLK